jgi:hypothetical protein
MSVVQMKLEGTTAILSSSGPGTALPEAFGFRNGVNSVHTSRTMMLGELSHLFASTAKDASHARYWAACTEENILGKKTSVTRKRTVERLTQLYGLDPSIPIFRILRLLWQTSPEARPMLAGLCAHARDPLLRQSADFILQVRPGETVPVDAVRHFLDKSNPGRFRPTTLLSAAQNIASSWTQCGYLEGYRTKKRRRPIVTPTNTTYALLLAYFAGARGQLVFSSYWSRLLDCPTDHLSELAIEASRRGWMDYRSVGQVIEVRFPQLLTAEEREMLHG